MTDSQSFVCSTDVDTTELAVFRSYDTTSHTLQLNECIWEACRATSAVPTFFDPIMIGQYNQKFADGGVLYKNPIQVLEQEASTILERV